MTADGGGSEAVALFADRARRADPRFALDEQAAAGVARLVTRLDGMPLAIELAAARVEALGVAQLLDRLDDRFALLAGGDRLAPSRQRSLAATVEWSYRLLDEAEQRVFRAVSVFPGPFTLEAAEAVAGQDAGPAVLRLVDCSLLVPPRAGPDGRARYWMLETLRGYGARLLAEAGEQDQAAAALAGCALGVAEQAAAGLQTSAGEAGAARWLDAEDATMRQVLAWAMDHDQADGAAAGGRAGLVVVPAGPLARPVPAAGASWPGTPSRAVTGGAAAADGRLGSGVLVGPGRGAGSVHRAAGRGGGPAAVPGAGRRPGRPVGGAGSTGPGPRGSRGCPPCPGRGPRDGLSGRGGAGPGAPRLRRRGGRRRGRGGAAGPAGRAGPGRHPRLDGPVVQLGC